MIAPEACRDDIIPSLLATGGDWNYVIEGQIFRGKFLAAILTRIVVASIDIRPGKFDAILVFYPNVFEQPDYRREFDRKCDRVNLLVIFVDYFNFACEKKGQRFFPGNDSQRLERCIQQQSRIHKVILRIRRAFVKAFPA